MNRRLVPMATRRAPREPVFAEPEEPVISHEPMFGHEHERQMRPYRSVPYPYRLGKMDPAWAFVLFLFVGGFVFPACWVIAMLIAALRVLVFCAYRWPLTTTFFVALFSGLMSGGRRRRW